MLPGVRQTFPRRQQSPNQHSCHLACLVVAFPSSDVILGVRRAMADNQPDEPGRRAQDESLPPGASTWFYQQRGEMFGPVSSADLIAAAHLGFLRPDDLVRRSGASAWVAASDVRGLFKNGD